MHLHSIEVALQGGPVPPRFISIKWGGASAPPEFTGGYYLLGFFNDLLVYSMHIIYYMLFVYYLSFFFCVFFFGKVR